MGQTSILRFIEARPIQQGLDKQAGDEPENGSSNSTAQNEQKLPNSPAPVSVSAQIIPSIVVNSNEIIIPKDVPQAAIVKIQPSHLPDLKNVTATLFPVKYSDKFFAETLTSPLIASISRTLLYDSKVVGLIRCRIDPFPSPENPVYHQIYIQTIGILAPFRGMGLATRLLRVVVDVAQRMEGRVTSVYAHVWEDSTDALEWYCRRGFVKVNLVPGYYRRLRPSGAWIIRREIG